MCSSLFTPLVPGYIEEFEIIDDHRSGKIVVNLNGRLNKCGVISPRFDVSVDGIDKWTNYLLPSRQFGFAPGRAPFAPLLYSRINISGLCPNLRTAHTTTASSC